MNFWKRLRWVASFVFISMLLIGWFGADSKSAKAGKSSIEARVAPAFTH